MELELSLSIISLRVLSSYMKVCLDIKELASFSKFSEVTTINCTSILQWATQALNCYLFLDSYICFRVLIINLLNTSLSFKCNLNRLSLLSFLFIPESELASIL